jgi:hypothetical protein
MLDYVVAFVNLKHVVQCVDEDVLKGTLYDDRKNNTTL